MKLSGSKLTMGLMALVVSAASVVFAIGNGDRVVVGAASTPNDVVVQTMDSCKTPQTGSKYTLTGSGGTFTSTALSGSTTGSLTGPTCPVQQGSCTTTSKGCLVFHNVPAGDYRLVEVGVPGPNATNPDGYAPCNSGSGCQWESADVTVNPDGSVLSQVTNMPPSGRVQLFPNDPSHAQYYAGTLDDPIVFHDFGLAKPGTVNTSTSLPNPQCDSDGDADDWSTGAPGSNCQDPEAAESTMCTNPTQFTTAAEGAQPSWSSTNFPWQCLSNTAAAAHLTSAIISGPSSVSALSTFQVNLLSGSTPSLVSTQDPGMSVVPNSMGFSVSLDPARTVAGKHTVGGLVTTGTVTITPEGGQGNSLVVAVGLPSPNANYIENLYHDLLGRYGSAGEIGYWSTKMDQGMTRGQIAQTFSMTPEFLGHMIDADFQSMVGAAPAPSDPGRAFWVNFLLHGGNNDTIMGSLGAAPNYYSQAGGADAGFITSLYSKVLHRTTGPSPADIQYWSSFGPFGGDANSGRRLQVANNFAFSTEQHRYVANGWYLTFLGRGADGPGLAYWTGQLDHGVLQQVMVNSFIATDEYYGHTAKY